MFVAANFVAALANLLDLVITVYIYVIIARALISWVSPDPYNPVVRFLYRVTEPVLRPIRYRMPSLAIGLDLSPMILILVLYFVKSFVVASLYELARELR
jgi:YggT family protein